MIDARPTTSRRVGERIKLQWDYAESEIPKMQEYRIYRADRIERNFQNVASVPANVLEYSMDLLHPGDFVIAVRAFDGVSESNPSNEVIVHVSP